MALQGWRRRLNAYWSRSWFDSEHLEKRLLDEGLTACRGYAHGLLLDVGCGQRRHEAIFLPLVDRYIGLDYPPVSAGIWVATWGERVDVWADGQRLPVASEAVDTVLCTQVLEHVPEPAQLMAELARVLKPGGHALVTVPQEWGVHQEPYDFYRYTRYGLTYLAEKAGLEVLRLESRGGFWAMMGQRWSAYLYDTTCRRFRRQGQRLAFVLAAVPVLPLSALSQLMGLGLDRVQHLDRNTLGYVLAARKRRDAARAWAGAALALALPLLLVALLTGLAFPAQTDEAKFHWDTIRQFGAALPAIPWQDYHAATPPLPYVLWGAWGRLFGYGLPALRALTLVLSYAGALAFYGVARARAHRWPLAEAGLLLAAPYVFLNSFTVYTVNVGLPFAVLALACYLKADEGRPLALLWGGLAAAAAIYCRQHYVFLPAGVGLWWLIRRLERGRAAGWHDARDLALIALPLALFAPLAVAWGGLTPPDLQGLHPLQISLQHVNFLFVFIGLYLAPVGVIAWPALLRWGRRAAWAAVGLPLYLAFRPAYQVAGDAGSSEQGLIQHGLELAQGIVGPALPALGQFALWANGVAIAIAGLGGRDLLHDDERLKLAAWVVAFAGIVTISDFVGERFYALIVPVLLLLFYPRVAGRRVLTALWVAGTAVLALAYTWTKMRGG